MVIECLKDDGVESSGLWIVRVDNEYDENGAKISPSFLLLLQDVRRPVHSLSFVRNLRETWTDGGWTMFEGTTDYL